jgi:hypothetical protein
VLSCGYSMNALQIQIYRIFQSHRWKWIDFQEGRHQRVKNSYFFNLSKNIPFVSMWPWSWLGHKLNFSNFSWLENVVNQTSKRSLYIFLSTFYYFFPNTLSLNVITFFITLSLKWIRDANKCLRWYLIITETMVITTKELRKLSNQNV